MKMKLLFMGLMLCKSLGAFAQTKQLPLINPPKELISGEFSEGTNTRLTLSDVQQFIPWAQNAQNVLTKALRDGLTMPIRERLPFIEASIKSVVKNSGTKTYQMFMRYALNRGLLLAREVRINANMADMGIQENILDILVGSIQVAIQFYEADLSFQNRAQNGDSSIQLATANFGIIFGQKMIPVITNILDASAEYRLLYKVYEMINWDLSRDPHSSNYADQIVDIYERLQSMSEYPSHYDEENLRNIRRLMLIELIRPKRE